MFPLWPHQKVAVDAIISHCKKSTDAVVIDMCVSSGKTNIGAHVTKHVADKGGRVLNITAVKELVQDAIETYGLDCGVCCASVSSKKETNKQVTFSSVQSLANVLKKFQAVDLILIDEVHNISDDNEKTAYMRAINHFKELNPKVRIVGMSGTPFRTRTGLLVGKARLFKKIISTVYIKDLIKAGFVTKPITPYTHNGGYDYSDLQMKMGKFQDKEVNKIALDERLTKTIIKDSLDLCQDRKKVIVFCATLEHAKEVQGYLEELGQGVVYLDGKLNKSDREYALEQFHTNDRIKFMVNRDILGTGYSFAEISAVIILRRTESAALLIQLVGRGLRLHPGKENCLILDYANNFEKLDDLLDNESITSIAPRMSGEIESNLICPICGFFNKDTARKCTCGFYFISKHCQDEKCGAENDITARHCKVCGLEIIDPNEALTVKPNGQEYTRQRYSTPHSQNTTKIAPLCAWTT